MDKKIKNSLSRRDFIKMTLATAASVAVPGALSSCFNDAASARKVILIAIDSLDPRYLYLDAGGGKAGRSGNWLMPNVRSFIKSGTWFENARCYMPAATDMNHLNAVAGGTTGESGINLVSVQVYDWNADGTPVFKAPSLSFARDGDGRPVDTLFAAWKRKWQQSKTFYVSGKEWVANMFAVEGSGVDIIINGHARPSYIPEPQSGYKFYDPPGDPDAATDAESFNQKLFSAIAYENNPQSYPPDTWTVDAALAMLSRERPDFGVVMLAQMDDLQHNLGAGYDPGEFTDIWVPTLGTVSASRYNPTMVFREAILDGVRDVDRQFGRLIQGIAGTPGYEDAVIVLYSDHGHITHREVDGLADMMVKSAFDVHYPLSDTDLIYVLAKAGVLTEEEIKFIGFCPIMASSMGVIHFMGQSIEDRITKAQAAKQALLAHRVWNKLEKVWECPWFVLDVYDMQNGIPGLCGPGELYHRYFAMKNEPGTLHWPDLFMFGKNRWQLPTIAGFAANIGMQFPEALTDFLAPVNIMIGGHGSNDTDKIVMAIKGPGIARGRVVSDPGYARNYRISDIAVTIASEFGLDIRSNTTGHDRSNELI